MNDRSSAPGRGSRIPILGTLRSFFRTPSPHVLPEDQRFSILYNYMFTYSLMGHALFTPIFYLMGDRQVVINNVLCTLLDALWLVLNYRGHIRLISTLWIFEIAAHAFYCILAFGKGLGFEYYFLAMTAPAIFLRLALPRRIAIVTTLFVLLFTALNLSGSLASATYTAVISERFINFGNAFASFAGLAYITFFYSVIVRRIEERLQLQKNVLEEEIGMAQRIQMGLLPDTLPDIGASRLAYRYVPMLGVGGDFVDMIHRQNRLALFICDVSGHGMPAALLASMVKVALNNWEATIVSPGGTLGMIKKALQGKMGNIYLTAWACSIDLDTGMTRLSGAGHPPVMVLRRDGAPELIEPNDTIIADSLEYRASERELRLERGDTLVMYTDGITEARCEGGNYGEEALVTLLGGHRAEDPAALCEAVYEQVVRFTGTPQMEDDFTIMAFRY